MGCDHLLCMKCRIGYDLEGGDVFWIGKFIQEHWHSKKKIPSQSAWFPANHSEFPYHLIVRHRVPHGFVSVKEPVHSSKDEDNSRFTFDREEVEIHIKQWKGYWTWWRKVLYYLESLWSAIKGEYYTTLFDNEPFIVDKNNKDHSWMVAFNDLWEKDKQEVNTDEKDNTDSN